MIYIFVPFFGVTDYDQNYMQMINLKKLPEYFKSFKIFVIVPGVVLHSFLKNVPIVSAYSQCPLSVFECADPMRNIHVFKLLDFLWVFLKALVFFSEVGGGGDF